MPIVYLDKGSKVDKGCICKVLSLLLKEVLMDKEVPLAGERVMFVAMDVESTGDEKYIFITGVRLILYRVLAAFWSFILIEVIVKAEGVAVGPELLLHANKIGISNNAIHLFMPVILK